MMTVATRQTQRTKALREEENESVRAFVRDIIADRFGGNQSAAAKEWGVTQPMISDLLSRKRGAGMKLLSAVSTYANVSIDQILGKVPPPDLTVVELDEHYHNRGLAAVAARAMGYPEKAIQQVQSVSLKSDTDLTADEWFDMMRAEKVRLERFAPLEQKPPGPIRRESRVVPRGG